MKCCKNALSSEDAVTSKTLEIMRAVKYSLLIMRAFAYLLKPSKTSCRFKSPLSGHHLAFSMLRNLGFSF